MSANRTAIFNHGRGKQRGAALIVMVVIMAVGSAAFLVNSLNSAGLKIKRDEITAAALAQAKDALIGQAVTYNDYPGSLPCPDTDDDGTSDAGGTTGCPQYIGRLPWKTLGLPDLRDAAGERLWYTLSRNVRRYASVRPLNSDTSGTLNITGTYTANNLMAIVFAPGAPLPTQSRSATQTAPCTTTDIPPSTEFENVCATNYLEGSNANLSKEANPVAGINPNQSYQNANASTPFNDQLISISQNQLFPLVEKRIAKEISNCLQNYASANLSRYPWAAPLDPSSSPQYNDQSGILFGRLPEVNFNDTKSDSSNDMSQQWPPTIACDGVAMWWSDWKEMVFYGLADAYKPYISSPAANACTPAGACLSVNPPSATADKKFVVIVAGKKLAGQVRSSNADKSTLSNYLEAPNNGGATPFAQGASSATFNDTVVFQ